MKLLPNEIAIKSPNGKTWGISAMEIDGYVKLYTREVDTIGEDFAIISSLPGSCSYKIKVNNKGRIYTYRIDDMDNL